MKRAKPHTAETGQAFAPEAIDRAFELTQGQPWLTNALGYEITEKMRVPVTETITVAHIEQAKEELILARATHLDSLVSKLREDRVKRILEPIIAGEMLVGDIYDDDALYVRDLGLVAQGKPLRIAKGLKQLDQYLAKTNLDTGLLIVFDRRKKAKAIEKRVKLGTEKTPTGKCRCPWPTLR